MVVLSGEAVLAFQPDCYFFNYPNHYENVENIISTLQPENQEFFFMVVSILALF